ncbi:MAG: hypothetical protein ACLFV2_02130 [Desulfurivibrionaceae bacterium]
MNRYGGFRPVIIGQFGPPVLACLRSWGRQGWRPGFICLARNDTPPPTSRYLDQWFRLDPRLLYTDQGLRVLRSCLESFNASGLLCISEKLAMWLDGNRESLKDFALWLPPAETVQKILSKKYQIETAEKSGLTNLPTYYLSKERLDALDAVPEDHFPLCLRPSGEGEVKPGFKVEFIQTRKMGRDFIQGRSRIDKQLIAQPYRDLPNLVVHGARSADDVVYGLQGFLVRRKFQGLTLTIRPMDLSAEFSSRCLEFVSKLGLVGNFHFEFLYDPETEDAYFLEINARLGGTTAKVFACGYDEPTLALQAYGEQVRTNSKVRYCTASSKLALTKYLYYTLKGKITPLDSPLEGKMARIFNTLRGLAFYRDDVLDLRDVSGTWAFYRQALLGKLS